MLSIIEKIAEHKIRAAQLKGDFDLPSYKNKKIDLSDYFAAPAHLRAAFSLLKNAGIPPAEISLKNEIYLLRKKIESAACSKDKNDLRKELAYKLIELNIQLNKISNRYAR